MDVVAFTGALEEIEADVLVLAVSEPLGPEQLHGLDSRLGGRLERLMEEGELKAKRGKVTTLHLDGELAAKRLAMAGLGKTPDADALRTAAAAIAKGRSKSVAWRVESAEDARAVVDGLVLGRYDAGRWKTDADKPPALETLTLCGPAAEEALDAAAKTALVAGWTNRARDLVNAPANALTPHRLAEVAEEIEERFDRISAEILGPDEIEEAGMGSFLSVSAGSHNPPRLITLRYEPESPADPELVLGLVGKGITFDSGGYSLKPASSLEDMKSDMGGAAAAMSALGAIAELELPLRVLVVVSATENMLSGHATRPGDVVRAANGTTIEINNTDAEGRLILADALLHARAEGATHLVDIATLTGVIEVALGNFYAGLFANDDEWRDRVEAAAKASGDHVWPMPMHRAYAQYLDSQIADLKNTPPAKRGGSTIAALFLERFAGEGPWAHLDIAGTAFLDSGRDYYPAGATGFGVRLAVELASSLTPTG